MLTTCIFLPFFSDASIFFASTFGYFRVSKIFYTSSWSFFGGDIKNLTFFYCLGECFIFSPKFFFSSMFFGGGKFTFTLDMAGLYGGFGGPIVILWLNLKGEECIFSIDLIGWCAGTTFYTDLGANPFVWLMRKVGSWTLGGTTGGLKLLMLCWIVTGLWIMLIGCWMIIWGGIFWLRIFLFSFVTGLCFSAFLLSSVFSWICFRF